MAMRRITAGISIALGTAVLLAGPAGARDDTFTLAEDEIGGATHDCGSNRVATAGGFKSDDDSEWEMVASQPRAHGWNVTLASGALQTATVEAICAGKSRYKIVKKRVVETDAQFGAYKRIKPKCPQGMTVAGGGFGRTKGPELANVLDSRPKGSRRWQARIYVVGEGVFVFRAYAVCDRRGADYAVRSETVDVDPARRLAPRGTLVDFNAKKNCRQSETLTGGGFATDDLNVRYWNLHPDGRGYRVAGAAYGVDPITSVSLCRK
jgi:hypothetical protein